MKAYDFSDFPNVELTGVDLSALDDEQLAVLYQQARYCQAMTDADTDTLREIVSPDAVFTHMSGRRQTREEYFADIESGALRYFPSASTARPSRWTGTPRPSPISPC